MIFEESTIRAAEIEQLKADVPSIEKAVRDPFLAEIKIRDEVLERLKFKEKDYFLKLRVCCAIMKSPRMMDEFRKSMERLKEL
jgi:hypothetical protein